ncbi:cold shock domain-containing protein [Kitasatospora sp. NBC_01560]|uniref:cold-shock protein n=1 Tax=Kitasatospora sp. NBC_01560 TaxID=2975965 RepID=UPI00386C0D93
MPTGTVSGYNPFKGYGSVVGDDGEVYTFVRSQVRRGANLTEHMRVSFEVVNGQAAGIDQAID